MAKKNLKLVSLDEKFDIVPCRGDVYTSSYSDPPSFWYVDENDVFVKVDKAKIVEGTRTLKYIEESRTRAIKKELIGKTLKYEKYRGFFSGPHGNSTVNKLITEKNVDNIWDTHNNDYHVRNAIYGLIRGCPDFSSYLNSKGNSWCNYLRESLTLPLILKNHTMTEVTPKELMDESNWKFKIGNTVDIVTKGETKTAEICGYTSKGFKLLFVDGSTLTGVDGDRLTVGTKQKRNLTLDMLPVTIKQNFEDVLNSPDLKVFEITRAVMEVEAYRGQMREQETDTIVCDFCGTQTPIKACIGCKKTYREVLREGDKILLMVGPDPKVNSINVEEVKCCDNCGLFGFGYGRHGKRINGYCTFSRQCVRAYNTCKGWVPENDTSYASNIKSAIVNLGYGVGRYGNKDISEFDYTQELHDENKKKAALLRQNYKVGYTNFIEMLKKKHGI